jgi:hypothetical protein
MTHCLVNHHITDHLVFVLVSVVCVMMCPVADNPAAANSHNFFLHNKIMSTTKIHCELWTVVHGQTVIHEWTVEGGNCRMFEDRQTSVHEGERSGPPSVGCDNLVQRVMLTSGIAFLHDNVHPHTAARTGEAFQLGAVWPPSLVPWPHSQQLPPV